MHEYFPNNYPEPYATWRRIMENPGACRRLTFSWRRYRQKGSYHCDQLKFYDGCPVLFLDNSRFGVVINGGEYNPVSAYIVPRDSCIGDEEFFWQ